MALDAATHSLVIGCRKPQMMVFMSAETGKVTASLPIGPGVDATKVDAGQAFASSADVHPRRRLPQGQQAPPVRKDATLAARTMGIDPTTHRIFMPTAEMQPAATAGGRPRPKPGTFMIVVVESK